MDLNRPTSMWKKLLLFLPGFQISHLISMSKIDCINIFRVGLKNITVSHDYAVDWMPNIRPASVYSGYFSLHCLGLCSLHPVNPLNLLTISSWPQVKHRAGAESSSMCVLQCRVSVALFFALWFNSSHSIVDVSSDQPYCSNLDFLRILGWNLYVFLPQF